MPPRNGSGYPLPASDRRGPATASSADHLALEHRWNNCSHHNLIKEDNFASKQDKYQRSVSLPFWVFPCFASAPPRFIYVDSRYLSSVGTSPRWQSPSTAPAGTASWPSADHRKQFIPLLMIYIISLDSILAYEVFCFFYYSLENQTRVFQRPGGAAPHPRSIHVTESAYFNISPESVLEFHYQPCL